MEQIKIFTFNDLKYYDPKLKSWVEDKISVSEAKSIKTVAIDGNTLKFYRVSEPVGETAPAYSITLPETDISGLIAKMSSATAGDVVIAKADGTVEDGGVKLIDLAKNSDVKDVSDKLGTIPEGYEATTIAGYAKELADAVAANGYDDTALKAKVTANETAISTLNGDKTQAGSVAKQVADAVAAIVANAPEAYDTLKEISDWISSHASDASEMNTQITTNKTDIANLKKFVGELPEGAASTTVIEYIAEAIGTSKTELTSAIATAKKAGDDAQTDVDALEAKVGTVAEGKTVVQMIADAEYDDTALTDRVTALENVKYVEITEAEIDTLFA